MTSDLRASSSDLSGMPRRLYLVVGFVVFLGSLLVTGGHLMSPDGELLFRQTESLALRGSFSVTPIEYDDPEMRRVIPASMTFATVPGRAGGFYVQYLPLQSFLSVPLVWLGKATESLFAEPFSRSLPDSPYLYKQGVEGTWRRAVVVALFNPIVNALTALVLMRIILFFTAGNRRAALYAALLYAFGTFALPHSRTYFTEPLAGLLALIALDQVFRWYHTPLTGANSARRLRQMIVMGAAIAGAIWTRMDSPFIALGMGLTLVAAGEWKRRREAAYIKSEGKFPLRDYAVSGGIIIVSFLALLAYNAWRFDSGGSLLGGGYSDQAEGIKLSTPFLVGLHGFLMSPGKGLFFFSPALVLAVWGWRRGRFVPWVGLITLGSYLPFALMQLKWQNWDGGWCWGPRHIFQLHAPMMLGAAFLFHGCESLLQRALVKVVAVVGLVVALFGCLQSPIVFYRDYFHEMMDGEYFSVAWRPAEWATIEQSFAVQSLDPRVQPASRQISPAALLPAPMVDSLYLPQHTQWAAYPRMLQRGICDWWLLARFIGPGDQELEDGESY